MIKNLLIAFSFALMLFLIVVFVGGGKRTDVVATWLEGLALVENLMARLPGCQAASWQAV